VLAALTIPRTLHPLSLHYVNELQQETAAPRPVITPAQVQAQIRRLGLVWASGDLDDTTYQRERARLQQLLADVSQQPADTPLPAAAFAGALERLGTFADAARAATPPSDARCSTTCSSTSGSANIPSKQQPRAHAIA
jgi:hypothetical protein